MSTLFRSQPEPDTPIVCDFTGASHTPEQHFSEYGRLFAAWLVGRERTADGVILTFEPAEGVADWVADLAVREAACCPFMGYEVSADATTVRWVTSGTEAMQPVLDEYFSLYDEVTRTSPEELIARFAAEGFEIRT